LDPRAFFFSQQGKVLSLAALTGIDTLVFPISIVLERSPNNPFHSSIEAEKLALTRTHPEQS